MKCRIKLIVVCLSALLVSCASGELGNSEQEQSNEDTGVEDVAQLDAGQDAAPPTDTALPDDVRDTASPDVGPDAPEPMDTDMPDAPQPDVGQDTGEGICESSCGAGVCNPATGACVDCLSDGDCAGGVCDTTNNTCVECTADSDCPGSGTCHHAEPICIPECCTPVREDVFTGVTRTEAEFDIAVSPSGVPAILFADTGDDALKLAERINNQWTVQIVAADVVSYGTEVALTFDTSGAPHIVFAKSSTLRHYWRAQSTWQSHDVLTSASGLEAVDIAADPQGGVHMVAVLDYGDEMHYASVDSQGQRSGETEVLPATYSASWPQIAATSDGRPIASFSISAADEHLIAEKSAAGIWQYETAGTDVDVGHGLAVGPDDEPRIAYRRDVSDGLRLLTRSGGTWQDDSIVGNPDHGINPDLAVDELGDAHFFYRANLGGFDDPPYYARLSGTDWQIFEVSSVAEVRNPRIALGPDRTPHAAGTDIDANTISYIRIDPR